MSCQTKLRTVAGSFRNNEFPQVAIAAAAARHGGTIYVAWSDGIDNVAADQPFLFGPTAYPTCGAKSVDGGHTFTVPQP